MRFLSKNKDTVNRYVLGSKPRLKLTPVDTNGIFFVPSESRISVKEPVGTITTYSGIDMTLASGYYYVIYTPLYKGLYAYEGWVRDSSGLEDASTKRFEVYDEVYYD